MTPFEQLVNLVYLLEPRAIRGAEFTKKQYRTITYLKRTVNEMYLFGHHSQTPREFVRWATFVLPLRLPFHSDVPYRGPTFSAIGEYMARL